MWKEEKEKINKFLPSSPPTPLPSYLVLNHNLASRKRHASDTSKITIRMALSLVPFCSFRYFLRFSVNQLLSLLLSVRHTRARRSRIVKASLNSEQRDGLNKNGKKKRKTGRRRRPKGEKTRNAGDEGLKRVERIDHFCRVASTVEHTHTHTHKRASWW